MQDFQDPDSTETDADGTRGHTGTHVENTAERHPIIHIVGAMSDGPGGYIEGMEAAGQRQLVASELLPGSRGDDDKFIALGFTFGEKVDDLFRRATLPPGWSRRGSEHNMWSYLVDETGTDRVAVFYKAAFYDRDAFMYVMQVES